MCNTWWNLFTKDAIIHWIIQNVLWMTVESRVSEDTKLNFSGTFFSYEEHHIHNYRSKSIAPWIMLHTNKYSLSLVTKLKAFSHYSYYTPCLFCISLCHKLQKWLFFQGTRVMGLENSPIRKCRKIFLFLIKAITKAPAPECFPDCSLL